MKFPLFPSIRDDTIKAVFSNGLLKIKVQKVFKDDEKPKPKKIILIEDVPDEELEFEENPNPVQKIWRWWYTITDIYQFLWITKVILYLFQFTYNRNGFIKKIRNTIGHLFKFYILGYILPFCKEGFNELNIDCWSTSVLVCSYLVS